jgi:hypothetical protein
VDYPKLKADLMKELAKMKSLMTFDLERIADLCIEAVKRQEQ